MHVSDMHVPGSKISETFVTGQKWNLKGCPDQWHYLMILTFFNIFTIPYLHRNFSPRERLLPSKDLYLPTEENHEYSHAVKGKGRPWSPARNGELRRRIWRRKLDQILDNLLTSASDIWRTSSFLLKHWIQIWHCPPLLLRIYLQMHFQHVPTQSFISLFSTTDKFYKERD